MNELYCTQSICHIGKWDHLLLHMKETFNSVLTQSKPENVQIHSGLQSNNLTMRIFPICLFLDKCSWRKERITWRICVKPYYCVCSTAKWMKDQRIILLIKFFIILCLRSINFHNTDVLIFCDTQCDQQKNIFFVIYLARSERKNLFHCYTGGLQTVYFFLRKYVLCTIVAVRNCFQM